MLFASWHWPMPPKDDLEVRQSVAMMNNVFTDLERRSRYGVLGNRDLVEIYGNLRQASLTLRDRGMLGGNSGKTILLDILESIAPHPMEVTQESLMEKSQDLADKLDMVKRLKTGPETAKVVTGAKMMLTKAATRRQQEITTTTVERREESAVFETI